MIVPAHGLQLTVLAKHVKAQFFDGLDIVDQRLIGWCRHQTVRPVSLIQNTVHKIRLVVEAESGNTLPVHFSCKASHGEITVCLVFSDRHGQVVEEGGLRRPADHIPNRDEETVFGKFPGENTFISGKNFYVYLLRLYFIPGCLSSAKTVSETAHLHRDIHRLLIVAGSYPQIADIGLWNTLHPHGLPDTTLGSVKNTAVFQFLLTAAVPGGVADIPHLHRQCILTDLQRIGNIEGKPIKTAVVSSDFPSIHKHRTALIHGAKMQDGAVILRSTLCFPGNHYLSLIPQRLIRLQLTIHAGQHTLR